MKAAIIMGSDSDWPILKPAVDILKSFGIEAEVVVASAHRTPGKVRDFVLAAPEKGISVFIVAAAGYWCAHQCDGTQWYGCALEHGADALRCAGGNDGD